METLLIWFLLVSLCVILFAVGVLFLAAFGWFVVWLYRSILEWWR